MWKFNRTRWILRSTSLLTITTFAFCYQQQQQQSAFNASRNQRNKNEPMMKAWHCHGRTQRDLVDRLRQADIVKSPAVQQVMEQVDRRFYIGETNFNSGVNPYLDTPQGIGKAQTISAPHMHARVLEEILPTLERNAQEQQDGGQTPVKVLDVGCGSGYLTACLGRWFSSKDKQGGGQSILPFSGMVYGMDIYPELVDLTRHNIQKNDGDLLRNGMISLKHGNGWLGWPEQAPFDAIHVGAAAASFPTQLALQLALHGVLIVPVGPTGNVQTLLKVERVSQNSSNNNFVWEDFIVTQLLDVRYVPLVQRPE